MTFDEAKELFIGKYFRYSELYRDETFVIESLPISTLPKPRLRFTTDYYVHRIKKGLGFPPIWIMAGYKLRSGKVQPFHYGLLIMDGNHRMLASLECGFETIPVCMAKSHLKIYKRRLENEHINREAGRGS